MTFLRNYAVQIVANTSLGHPSFEGREVPPLINYGTISANGADEIDAAIMAYDKLIGPHLDRYLPWIEDRVQSHEYFANSQPDALRAGLIPAADHPYAGSTDIVLRYQNQAHEFFFRVLPLNFKDMQKLMDIGKRILEGEFDNT